MDFIHWVDSTQKQMAATESRMRALGTTAPAFALPDVETEKLIALEDIAKNEPFLIIFLCAHCPNVLHVAPEIARITQEYSTKAIKFVAITSNDIVHYPQDAPEPTVRFAKQYGLTLPILFDECQSVAHMYAAACTPDFFLFDQHRKLFSAGRWTIRVRAGAPPTEAHFEPRLMHCSKNRHHRNINFQASAAALNGRLEMNRPTRY